MAVGYANKGRLLKPREDLSGRTGPAGVGIFQRGGQGGAEGFRPTPIGSGSAKTYGSAFTARQFVNPVSAIPTGTMTETVTPSTPGTASGGRRRGIYGKPSVF